MTPEEKAKELIFKYDDLVPGLDCYYDTKILLEDKLPNMKECALIAANEVLKQIPYINIPNNEVLKRIFWMDTIEAIKKYKFN